MAGPGTVVLVHGGFVDGSGWQGVYSLLRKDGDSVAIVQNPTLSLEGDVAATKRVIDAQDEPVILVGHSYGGAVITEAGNDPNVAALVYIAAFAPDEGESVNTLIGGFPKDAPGRRSCRRKMDFCSSTGRSSTTHSRPTWMPSWRRSWLTHRCRGRRRPGWDDQRGGVAEQAELVSDRHRRPNDPAASPARDVRTSGLNR
jgi:pimeloyl-ACP methyl ester carboxylesterase